MSDTTPIPAASERELLEEVLKLLRRSPKATNNMYVGNDDVPWGKQASALSRRIAAALSHPSTPQGWKLVPVDPTVEMLRAADRLPDTFSLGDEYRAMLNAAPPPPEQGGKG